MKLLQAFKRVKENQELNEKIEAGEIVPAIDDYDQTSIVKTPLEVKEGHNFAEFICYYSRKGVSSEDIAGASTWSVEEIEGVIEEAKRENVYNLLADKFTE